MARTIVVSGGGTGIGRAVATRFATAGEHVVITGRRSEMLRRVAAEVDGDVRTIVCDAADPRQVAAVRDALTGPVDVLVNNAGGNTDLDRAPTDDPGDLAAVAAAWRANLDANLVTAVLMTSALTDRLAPGGAVIGIGSIAADKGSGAYGAAKAGLASWNVALARELGPRDITANVVAPGFVADTEFFRDRLTPERRDGLVAASATGRASAPDDIAAAVEFLASPGARQITGQVLDVNGGERTTR